MYFPGLHGDYVFDDITNIIDNKKIAISALDYENLKSAWYSSSSSLAHPPNNIPIFLYFILFLIVFVCILIRLLI